MARTVSGKRFSFTGPIKPPYADLQCFPSEEETEWIFCTKKLGRSSVTEENFYEGTLEMKKDTDILSLWSFYSSFNWSVDDRPFEVEAVECEKRTLYPDTVLVSRGNVPDYPKGTWEMDGDKMVLVRMEPRKYYLGVHPVIDRTRVKVTYHRGGNFHFVVNRGENVMDFQINTCELLEAIHAHARTSQH